MSLIEDIVFAVTDVEATGSNASKNRIMEVGRVFVKNGLIIDEKHTFINPEQFIPPYVQLITGITNAETINFPKAPETMPILRSWFPEGSVFTAHNVLFDFNFMQAEFQRHKLLPLRAPHLCTLRLAKRLLPKRRKNGLSGLSSYFGIKLTKHHSAIEDARATAKILIELLDILQSEHECEQLDDVLRFQHRTIASVKTMPVNIKKISKEIRSFPTTSGIYKIFNSKKELLYIGKAKNLKSRLNDYFSPSASLAKKIAKMVNHAKEVEIIQTDSEIEALILESRMIKEHRPPYNTMQKRYRGAAFLKIDHNTDFPMISVVRDIDSNACEYYGPFPGLDSAMQILQVIEKNFKLRKCEDMPRPNLSVVPCFYHQINRCDAPCALLQSHSEYKQELDKVREFLSGKEGGAIDKLNQEMQIAAENLEFESAAEIRNQINNLHKVFSHTAGITGSINSKNGIFISGFESNSLSNTKTKNLGDNVQRNDKLELCMEAIFIKHGRIANVMKYNLKQIPKRNIIAKINSLYFSNNNNALNNGLISAVAVGGENIAKPQIDEMRIIASYLYRKRHEGKMVNIENNATQEEIYKLMKVISKELSETWDIENHKPKKEERIKDEKR